jgi:hypothetical protein
MEDKFNNKQTELMEKNAEIGILKEKAISLEARVSEADKNREIMAR